MDLSHGGLCRQFFKIVGRETRNTPENKQCFGDFWIEAHVSYDCTDDTIYIDWQSDSLNGFENVCNHFGNFNTRTGDLFCIGQLP